MARKTVTIINMVLCSSSMASYARKVSRYQADMQVLNECSSDFEQNGIQVSGLNWDWKYKTILTYINTKIPDTY